MLLYLQQAALVCPLVFIAGFIDAVAGGGGLISLPAYLLTGLPVRYAIGCNKTSSCLGTAIATTKYAKSGLIELFSAAFSCIFALVGSTLGATLALGVDNGVFKYLLLVLLPLTAIYTYRTKTLGKKLLGKEPSFITAAPLLAAIAFFIGVYDGFYGPGTGTILILLFTGVIGMASPKANGLTKAINLTTNVAALSVYIVSGNVLYGLALTAGAFSIAGNYLGSKYFMHSDVKKFKAFILLVISVFFIKTVGELIGIL